MGKQFPIKEDHAERISQKRTKNAILDNLEAGPQRKTWNQLAEELGISPKTIYRRLAAMRKRGAVVGRADEVVLASVSHQRKMAEKIIKTKWKEEATARSIKLREEREARLAEKSQMSRHTPPAEQSKSWDEILREMDRTQVMDRETRLKRLSYIAENGADAVKIQAMDRLEEMEKASGSTYGPPPPTTEEDMLLNLVLLFNGLPRGLIEKAMVEAYEKRASTEESPENSQS